MKGKRKGGRGGREERKGQKGGRSLPPFSFLKVGAYTQLCFTTKCDSKKQNRNRT